MVSTVVDSLIISLVLFLIVLLRIAHRRHIAFGLLWIYVCLLTSCAFVAAD